MLGEGIEGRPLDSGRTFRVGEGAMDEKVGVSADGGGEVGVVGFGQAEVAETFGRIDGPLEGAEEADF
jgi:hypothetical protein